MMHNAMINNVEKREDSAVATALSFVVKQTIGLLWLSYMIKAPLWKLFRVTWVVACVGKLTALDVAAVVYFLQQMAEWGAERGVWGMGAGNWTGS